MVLPCLVLLAWRYPSYPLQALTSDCIATTNLTVTNTLNGRAVSDILPTYKKYIALISQSSTAAPTVIVDIKLLRI